MSNKIIRIATRKSKLALWQAEWVRSALLKKYPELKIILHTVVTPGDQQQSIPLTQIGGKSVFVKALQQSLLSHEADIAVHSIKDMSVHPTDGLVLAAICEREDPRDAFLSLQYTDVKSLPENAIVGTASPRRSSFLLSMKPNCEIKLLRGNVDTRVKKLLAGEYDAIILAAAGLKRLGLESHIRSYFSIEQFIPAIGQGAIGIECREDNHSMREYLEFLNHGPTEICVRAEKTVNKILNGDCHTAIGAHALIEKEKIVLSAMIASADGRLILRAKKSGELLYPEELGKVVANDLLIQGAEKLLKGNIHA